MMNVLKEQYSELVKEWHPTLNGELTPQDISHGSNKKVWWVCSQGHSYDMSPNNKLKYDCRTKRFRVVECPYCTGNRILKGYNDISTTHPEIFEEWDIENNYLDPFTIGAGSHLKVNWKCSKGHRWSAKVESRTRLGRSCPYCSGKKVLAGFNDLGTLNPKLAQEWHPSKNGELTPKDVTLNTHKKYWWVCDKGHEWQISPHNRNFGTNCPFCSGRFAINGETDLATTHPELAQEWHPSKNGELSPEQITSGSHKKVWWKCSKGHEWLAVVHSRSCGNGCPFCFGRIAIVGETDLATVYPEIAREWNYEKNKGKTPQMFTKASSKKVWWVCNVCGSEWRTCISIRARGSSNCPCCK